MNREEAIARLLEKRPHDKIRVFYYTNFPRIFSQDLKEGRITRLMYDILLWVYENVNWKWCRVERASAEIIRQDIYPPRCGAPQPSVRTIQRNLKHLDGCGYISLPKHYDLNNNYVIYVHGYVVELGGEKFAVDKRPTITYEALRRKNVATDDAADDERLSQVCRSYDEAMTRACPTCDDSSLYVTGEAVKTIETNKACEAGAAAGIESQSTEEPVELSEEDFR